MKLKCISPRKVENRLPECHYTLKLVEMQHIEHGEALGPSGENFESRWSVNGNIGYFTPLFENDKNWNIW